MNLFELNVSSNIDRFKNGYVKIPFTQTALAEHLGVNRSALSRELGRMQSEGVLEVDGRKMRIV